ncbi:MAG: NFACT family protein [archaeon]
MKALSSLDIVGVVHELQGLVGAKVQKVYQIDDMLLFELYLKGQGAVKLLIKAGERIHLTRFKREMPKLPPAFCMLLRKYAEGASLSAVRQHDFDRVVELEFESGKEKAKHILIAELFSKGNLIFCDANYSIIQPLRVEFWKTRAIKPKAKYEFPPASPNLKEIEQEEFTYKLSQSSKTTVTTLAVIFGLGGEYAEKVCSDAKVDKTTPANTLSPEQSAAVWAAAQHLLSIFKKASGLNEKIDETYSPEEFKKIREEADMLYTKRKATAERREKELKEAIAGFSEKIEASKTKAEYIQTHHQEVQALIDGANRLHSQGKGWDEIEKDLGVKTKDGKLILRL